jgi:hypothetical protein
MRETSHFQPNGLTINAFEPHGYRKRFLRAVYIRISQDFLFLCRLVHVEISA